MTRIAWLGIAAAAAVAVPTAVVLRADRDPVAIPALAPDVLATLDGPIRVADLVPDAREGHVCHFGPYMDVTLLGPGDLPSPALFDALAPVAPVDDATFVLALVGPDGMRQNRLRRRETLDTAHAHHAFEDDPICVPGTRAVLRITGHEGRTYLRLTDADEEGGER
ncbi:hypothetical protein [Jannaschia sp. LMIT008]|uniref:hypothetical protein n=1 Tax=Jannaschia maritima TaxID=3032585 RepID=UPI002811CD40|nr:hypothetical protein [Jannaschia sp. LMIT008]